MQQTFRQRVSRAAAAGVIGATVTVAAQYFIGVPVGRQPGWLGTVASTTALPAEYILSPFSKLLQHTLGTGIGAGMMSQTSTPFGPAWRFERNDLALVAFATLVLVAIADYAAQGVTDAWEHRKHRWPVLN